jgi:lathosterol oxidase
VSAGGLASVVLEQLLVHFQIIQQLPSGSTWQILLGQFLLYFLAFDCYYYFLHRFYLHSKWGWHVHKVHHDSFVCTPATGFSFHWWEGFITGGFNPVLAHLLRFDLRTVLLCQLYGVLNTIFVHLGVQAVPSWWDQSWLTKWYLSSQFHDVHHQKVSCNFGGFTTLYDRAFGTVYKNYEVVVENLARHIAAGKSSSGH